MSDSIFPRHGSTALLIVDVQERLVPVIGSSAAEHVVRQTAVLLQTALAFHWPVVYSEQYPKGLGATVSELAEPLAAASATRVEKVEFSVARNPGFASLVMPSLPSHVVVAGMETHICVLQTVADLQARGHQVFLAADACGSRTLQNHQNGLDLMARVGATVSNTETLLFFALQQAGTDAFRTLSKLIR